MLIKFHRINTVFELQLRRSLCIHMYMYHFSKIILRLSIKRLEINRMARSSQYIFIKLVRNWFFTKKILFVIFYNNIHVCLLRKTYINEYDATVFPALQIHRCLKAILYMYYMYVQMYVCV